MKRRLSLLLVLAVLLSVLSVLPVHAAGDFTVENGLLTRYNGTAKHVTIPSDVTVIGAGAFEGDANVTSVTLPDAVTVIEDRAFCDCTALTTVNGGNEVSRIGVHAFRNTPYLHTSTDKYLMLGKVLLWYNGTSDSVTIPTRCEAIAPYAFMRCSSLKTFLAQGNLVEIGAGAFYDCANLTSVSIPSSVTEVGAYAFDGTPYLNSLGAFATVGDGVLIKYAGSDTAVTVPNTVKRIASAAFMSLSKITSVRVPSSVYSIDAYAFADCVGLQEIKLSEGLVNIGDGAFRGCKALQELLTPSTLSYIGQHAFNGAADLEAAHLCGDHLTVSYNAFRSSGLKYVLLSRGVTGVYDGSFSFCSSLSGFSVPKETSIVGIRTLYDSAKATVVCSDSAQAAASLAANRTGAIKGDVDSDGEMTVIDVSRLQRFLALMIPLNGLQTACADVDYDADIAVTDATLIQYVLAEMIPNPD